MSTPTERILDHFESISAIPRGTKNEAGIRQWLIDWAASRRFPSRQDAVGNLVVHVPASAGRESEATLILQGHLDMVCQKTPESTHDFTRDPIKLVRDGEWIRADGTTLGADNGIAIALMMEVAEDPNVTHPPLELLFTVEEEVGISGATELDPGLIRGKTLINLDTEDEGVFTVGCAGGGSVFITLPVTWKAIGNDDVAFALNVGGLKGGHSGGDINKHRANANLLMTRVLEFIQRNAEIRLSMLKGGSARNAIPRDADAIFVCRKQDAALCSQAFTTILSAIQAEHRQTEPTLVITLKNIAGQNIRTISAAESLTALRLLMSLPNGVAALSAEMPGFLETSNNIGIVELKENGLYIVSNHRSSVFSRLEELTRRVEALAWMAGARTERNQFTPPWQPNMDSPLLKKCSEAYVKVTGRAPVVETTHGGLECGIISDRCGGMDTISLGPTILDPHSPNERLHIPAIAPTWELLKAVLAS
jgi:dipeptidase D